MTTADAAGAIRRLFPRLHFWSTLPSFAGWIALSAGILLGHALPCRSMPSLYLRAAGGAIILLTVLAVLVRRLPARTALFFICGVLLIAVQRGESLRVFGRDGVPAGEAWKDCVVSGRIISAPLEHRRGFSFVMRCDSLYSPAGCPAIQGKNLYCISRRKPGRSDLALVKGTYRAPAVAREPGAFDSYSYYLSNGIWGTLFIERDLVTGQAGQSPLRRLSDRLRGHVYSALSGVGDRDAAALLQASFLGEKNLISPQLNALFRTAGISHLLALSGFHVMILTGAFLFLLRPLPLSRLVKTSSALAGIWFYLFWVGPIPSFFRAVVMATVIACSQVFQRRSHPINALGAAGIIWLYLSPISLFTPGYLLSFSATFGILTLYPLLAKALTPAEGVARALIGPLSGAFALSLSASIATFPVIVHFFRMFSVAGLVINVWAVLLMTVSMWSFFGALLAYPVSPAAGDVLARLAGLVMRALISSSRPALMIPGAVVQIPPMPLSITLVYAAFFIGCASVRKNTMKPYLVWSLSLLFPLVPALLLLSRL